jgi:hypothetical protein
MANKVSFTVEAASVKTELGGYGNRYLRAEIEEVDLDDLIKEIGISDILDAIGKDAAAEHFDLVEERDLNA